MRAGLRSALGPRAFGELRDEGRKLNVDEAVALALAALD